MPKINILDKHTADLIAAGEVVERPASAVKELVENSIDAGATSVTVEIQNGGISYIRITDNGCGISREDVKTAFLPHATSKIKQKDDLNSILTLGFRGEALASIAAVSRVDILTRTADETFGTRYSLEGGEQKVFDDAGCPVGTTIVVKDLFFNTPARMKFLKKNVSEGNAVADAADRMALSHPEVSIKLIRDGKETLCSPGDGNLLSAIYAVYGKEFASGLIPVKYESDGIRVEGYVSKPLASRKSRSMQLFFLNGRFVRSGTASAALSEAYRNSIMAGKFPACVLHIKFPPSAVDVNVHPAKLEVRFENEKPVFDAIYYGVKNALMTGDTRPEAKLSDKGLSSQKAPFSRPESLYKKSNMFAQQKFLLNKREKNGDLSALNRPAVKGEGEADFAKEQGAGYPSNGIDSAKVQGTGHLSKDGTAFDGRQSTETFANDENNQNVPSNGKTADGGFSEKGGGAYFREPQAVNGAFEYYRPPVNIDVTVDDEDVENPVFGESSSLGAAGNNARGDGKNGAEGLKVLFDERFENSSYGAAQNGAAESTAADNFAQSPGGGVPEKAAFAGEAPESAAESASGNTSDNTLARIIDDDKTDSPIFIGEVFATYIIVQVGKKLLLIDKHAAHERILFDSLCENHSAPSAQMLLEPVTVTLRKTEHTVLLENADLLERAGILVEDFGMNSIIIRSVPMNLDSQGVCEIIEEVADRLLKNPNRVSTEKQEWIYHSIACRAAIKAGDKSDKAELMALCERIVKDDSIRYCPHGRPVAVWLSKYELEKQFGRA